MSETMENALVVLPASSLPSIIAADKNDILGNLKRELAGYVPDATTVAGRAEIGSKAKKVGTAKAELVRLATMLKEDAKKLTDAVNAERRIVEENCDAIRDRILAPRVEFEQREANRVAEHQRQIAAIAEHPNFGETESSEDLSRRLLHLTNYPTRDWQEFKSRADAALAAEIARTEGLLARALKREAEAAELARLRAEEAERARLQAIRDQEEREARIAAEAAERARVEAERRTAEAAAEAERREREAREQVERERAAAEQRAAKAEADRIAAEQRAERERIEAAEAAERRQAQAVEDERRRVAAEAAAVEAERQRREANVAHKKKINREALTALVACGQTEELGIAVVTAIAKGAVPHVSIGY